MKGAEWEREKGRTERKKELLLQLFYCHLSAHWICQKYFSMSTDGFINVNNLCWLFWNCLKLFGLVQFSSSCLIQMKRFWGYQNQWKIKFCRVFAKLLCVCGMWKGALIQKFIDRLGYQQKDTDTDTSTLPLSVSWIEMNDGHDILIFNALLFFFLHVCCSLFQYRHNSPLISKSFDNKWPHQMKVCIFVSVCMWVYAYSDDTKIMNNKSVHQLDRCKCKQMKSKMFPKYSKQ